METKQLYLKIADVDMENQGSNNEPLLLSPPRHRKGIRTGVVIFCLLAVAFFITYCCPLFQIYKAHHHSLDYSQADSFYASNDPPYPYYDDDYNYDSNSGSSSSSNNSNEKQQQQQQQHIYVEAPTASPTGQQHIYYAWNDLSHTNRRLRIRRL